MSNGDRAPRSVGLTFCYVPEMVIFLPARHSLRELSVKRDRHTEHDLNMARGGPGWRIRWIARALAILKGDFGPCLSRSQNAQPFECEQSGGMELGSAG